MNKNKKLKRNEIKPEKAKAILEALKDFYPEFYKTLINFSENKFKLKNYK